MITLAEAQDLYNLRVLPYRFLIGGEGSNCTNYRLRVAFIAWRRAALNNLCPVCGKTLEDYVEIDHQHPMDRKRGQSGRVQSDDNLRGYVREIVHPHCNTAISVVERGCASKRFPDRHNVKWYLIEYACPDEPLRRARRYQTLADRGRKAAPKTTAPF
jgi:hypothetical protein